MDTDTIIGIILLVASLSSVICLVVWSKLRIDKIAENGYENTRQMAKSLSKKGNQ